MAKVESKSLVVLPEKEQEMIEKYELFGWTLLSSQEVHTRSTHTEGVAPGKWQDVVTTTNYVKLVFQRETDKKQDAKLRELEEKYWKAYEATERPYPSSHWFPKAAVIALAFGLGVGTGNYFLLFLFLGLAIAGIVCFQKFVEGPRKEKYLKALDNCKKIEKEVRKLIA